MPHSTYLPDQMGRAEIAPAGAFEAGSFQSFTLTYTAGRFGMDDTGSLKIVFRFAADMGRIQFDEPAAPNYTTVEASNNAVLECRYDPKGNIRPWDKTVYIKVVRGFMKEGDRIAVRFGDPREGSPGMRLQTFCESTFEFRVLADPIATCNYVELPESPTISIVAGPPVQWKAVLPTLRRVNEPFRLCIKPEDRWGNANNRADGVLRLQPSQPVDGLPETVDFRRGRFTAVVDDLRAASPGDLTIDVQDSQGSLLTTSNPLRIAEQAELLTYWGDLHGQSEETIGTNSLHDYLTFARDRAFLDVCGHQGNDFQITADFWSALNRTMAEFNAPGRFVTVPGYEWSGNTALGGDRNVFFRHEGSTIRRSSHALIEDLSDAETDCHTAAELFEALAAANEHAVVIAHAGGRYADIRMAHDGRFERSVEIHSAWGTFEWLLHDAFKMGYRAGVVCNSDGHKGRPGASHPGASWFGAYGGLTCFLMPELSREALFECLRKRHHYGTSGARMLLDVRAHFEGTAELFDEDPALGATSGNAAESAMMGDIVRAQNDKLRLWVDVVGSAPIDRMELRRGSETLATVRPYAAFEKGGQASREGALCSTTDSGLGASAASPALAIAGESAATGSRRIRIVWEGAEYRGRFRQVVWDGRARVLGNRIMRCEAINFWNLERVLEQTGPHEVTWRSLTTGNFSGAELWLEEPAPGTLQIETGPVCCEVPIAEIGMEDRVFESGGLGRRLRVYRLAEENPHRRVQVEREVILERGKDNPLWVCVTQEDGHCAWSSPIWVIG